MHAWQLQEAKSRFSELVELTLKEGPQLSKKNSCADFLGEVLTLLGWCFFTYTSTLRR